MEEKKLTKKEYYGMSKEVIMDTEIENKEDLVEFIDAQVALIETKAMKAKEKRAEKNAEGDELRNAVQSVLTSEFQSADSILGQIEGEDLTKAKIIARLTQLVKAGVAEKTKTKTEDKKEITVYKLAE